MKARLVAIVLCLVLLIVYTRVLRSQAFIGSASSSLTRIPRSIDGYVGDDRVLDERVTDLLGADETMYRIYESRDGRPMWIFLGHFDNPQENSQIHSPKHCYPGSGWNIVAESTDDITIEGVVVPAQMLEISNGRTRRIVLYWFRTDSGIITSEYRLKWDQMKNALLRRSQRATFVRFSTLLGPEEDPSLATHDLEQFIKSMGPYITSALNGDS